MIKCPNCKKELADGTKFCTACGTKIDEAAASQKKGLDVGKIMETIKAVPKKMWAIGGGILAVAIVAIVAIVVLMGMAPKDKYVVYLKDGDLYMSMLDGKDPIELAKKFVSDDANANSTEILMSRGYIRFSEDGNTVFFPKKMNAYDGKFDLYYRSTSRNAEEERIAKNVSSYAIDVEGKNVFYLSEGTLYQHNLKEETEIEDDIRGFWVSKDGKKVLFQDTDYDLYQWNGKDAERIEKAISVVGVADDVNKVFYTDRESDLYVWNYDTGEAKKIDDAVSQFITGYDNGGAYYAKINTITTTMADYIIDDYAASDAAMEKPVYPNRNDYTWPEQPDYPYSWNYDSYEEYEAAYAQYLLDYEKYQSDYNAMYDQYQKDIDKYYEDYNAWSAKDSRDYYRQYFSNYTYNTTFVELYYFDGNESKLVVDNINMDAFQSYNFGYHSGDQAPVMSFYVSKMEESAKIKIEEISSLSSTNRLIKNSLTGSLQFAIASGADSKVITDGKVNRTIFSEDGKHIYYLVMDEAADAYVVYEVAIDGSISDAVEYDREVGYVWGTLSNGQIVYFKDYDEDNAEGTLYIGKEKIEKKVYQTVVEVKEKEALYFWTKSNGDEGDLCYYDGKEVEEIQEDVSIHIYGTSKDGGFIGLVDYSYSKNEGKLYYFEGTKKATELDEDVTTIMKPFGF